MPRSQKPTEPARISISGARASYVGPGLDLAPHRNAAATVAIALETPFSLSFPSSGDGAAGLRAIALIPPNTVHHLRACGLMAFVYLDALSDDHRRLRATDLECAHVRFTGTATRNAATKWDVDALCAELGVPARAPSDPRLSCAIRQLDERPQDFASVRDAAALASLSPSRFQALFVEAVGVPFRRYRLWRRMALVMRALSEARSLTETAHAAGFSSSAHLSTSFREMFGLTPSSLVTLRVRIDAREASGMLPTRQASTTSRG